MNGAAVLPMTVVILTRNEAGRLATCIASVRSLVEEIVVVDSGSSDQTCEVAAKLGARVVREPWPGDFSLQRNLADRQVRTPWLLHLDADETISPPLAQELRAFFTGEEVGRVSGGRMPRKEKIFGRWIEHGGWYPQHKLRLYRRGEGTWQGRVHEHLALPGPVHTFEQPILHDSYRDIETFVAKFNRYSSLDAEEEFQRRGRFSLFKLVFQPLERFLGRYLGQRGYRDGFHGLVLAMLIGWNYFLRHLKIWELSWRASRSEGEVRKAE